MKKIKVKKKNLVARVSESLHDDIVNHIETLNETQIPTWNLSTFMVRAIWEKMHPEEREVK